MQPIDQIAAYANGEGRNHIVFAPDTIGVFSYHNVGKELAEAIKASSPQYDAYELVMSLFSKPMHDDTVGNYIALQNINILFEEELRLDLRRVFDALSRESCLIIATTAVIEQNWLHFEGTKEPRVDLQGLSYLQIA